MKKSTIILTLLTFALSTSISLAQSFGGKDLGKIKEQKEQIEKRQKQLNAVLESLDLSDDKKEILKSIQQEYMGNIKALKEKYKSSVEKSKEEKKALHSEKKEKIKALLSEEEYEAYKEAMKALKEEKKGKWDETHCKGDGKGKKK